MTQVAIKADSAFHKERRPALATFVHWFEPTGRSKMIVGPRCLSKATPLPSSRLEIDASCQLLFAIFLVLVFLVFYLFVACFKLSCLFVCVVAFLFSLCVCVCVFGWLVGWLVASFVRTLFNNEYRYMYVYFTFITTYIYVSVYVCYMFVLMFLATSADTKPPFPTSTNCMPSSLRFVHCRTPRKFRFWEIGQ